MICFAKLADFDSIFVLIHQLWPKAQFSKNKTQQIYANLLQRKDTISIVFKMQNKVVGFAYVELRDDFHVQGKVGHLGVLIVDKEIRSKGIGTKLLQQIIKLCKKAKCKKLKFTSNFKRKSAHRFYESLGFQKAHYLFWKDF